MVRCYKLYNSEDIIFVDIPIGLRFHLRPNTIVNSKDGVDFAMLFTLKTRGMPEDFRSCVVKGSM